VRLKKAQPNRLRRASAELVALIMGFALLMFLLIVVMGSAWYKEYVSQPIDTVVNTYTQQFAAYGTDELPEYASVLAEGGPSSITERMREALLATGNVASVDRTVCGLLTPTGVVPGQTIYAGSAVGCEVDVTLYQWPWSGVNDGTSLLFGADYNVLRTGFTDKGENPNLR